MVLKEPTAVPALRLYTSAALAEKSRDGISVTCPEGVPEAELTPTVNA